MSRKFLAGALVVLAAAALLLFALLRRNEPELTASLDAITGDYRRIIVLMDGAESLDDALRARCVAAGRLIFYRKQQAMDRLEQELAGHPLRIRQLVRYLSDNRGLHDADKLAFLDLVETLEKPGARYDPLKPVLDNLQSIQLAYREEVTRIFSQFATRGGRAAREKWDAYVASLRQRQTREQVLADFPDLPTPAAGEPSPEMRGGPGNGREFFGTDFAPRSVALTFDDGPHPRYTDQVLALLRKYGIRATFFELGTNLGTVSETGEATLSKNAEIARKVLADGHTIANHSFSHPVLPKLPEAQRQREIERTTQLLTLVAGHRPELFRAPYGARNQQILDEITADGYHPVPRHPQTERNGALARNRGIAAAGLHIPGLRSRQIRQDRRTAPDRAFGARRRRRWRCHRKWRAAQLLPRKLGRDHRDQRLPELAQAALCGQ